MGEINIGEADADKATDGAADKGADATQDESQNAGGATDEGAEGDEKKDEKGSDAGDGDDTSGGDDADKSEKKDKKAPDKKPTPTDDEPPRRARNADFIIERQEKKAQKNKDGGADQDKGADEADDDVAPEDAEIIDKRIAKALKPLAEKQMQEADKAEIDAFVAENPDFKPYADKVAKWAKHPSRQGIPIKSLFFEVAGDDLMKIGADRRKKADDEARKTGAGGGTNRSGGGATKGAWEMSPEEFAAEQAKVRDKQAD